MFFLSHGDFEELLYNNEECGDGESRISFVHFSVNWRKKVEKCTHRKGFKMKSECLKLHTLMWWDNNTSHFTLLASNSNIEKKQNYFLMFSTSLGAASMSASLALAMSLMVLAL